ncbi:permease for cytosine/purines, uracil, thiamine, allantoin-domain-containing protein [Clohesyomyces aquaticus]|uniref:Permease for cytosine/purines, uracil, thiamine, allantoin-domain-containing protein n=1 Tax=Clohesyomyces aquaticus TaxID=1231657 RepID=A0A1Y1Y9X0_9PLEO|nr:permease for cytosine/purines, uracil, thiamine, allantoin-domain-containing protein [Clohesyomyces aquaticus]
MTNVDIESVSEKDAIKSPEKFNVDVNVGEQAKLGGLNGFLAKLASRGGVELRGANPVPYEERTVTQYLNIFSLWFCMSCNPLPITFGMVGTLSFGLGLRDSALIILFFTLISTIPVAYLSTWGPRTGMRQLVLARFAFGKYLVSIIILLNLATLTGFCVVDSVIGGQALSAVMDGETINATVGIVIIALLSLLISFCGFKVLHIYERFAWIPALVAIIIATGCGGKHLSNQVEVPPATAQVVLSFGGLVASFMLPWAALASDFSTYMHPKAPPFRIALYTYMGLALPTILLMILGAAIGGATPNIPSWTAGYESNSASGILAAMMHPAGGFGRFVTVILAFSMLGNLSATMYSITLNFQMFLPFLFRIPRAIYSVIITAIVIGVAIEAAKSFFVNLENFIGVIGYWSAAFIGVVVVEHLVFRRSSFNAYTEDENAWDDAKKLPLGSAAIGAAVLSFGLIVPGMSQIWFTGTIAEKTGDIGFEFALVVSALLYLPLRYVERKMSGR